MPVTVVGLFDDNAAAERAVRDLLDAGLDQDQVSVVTSAVDEQVDSQQNMAAEGAATGLTTGAVVGGIVGLLAGAGVLLGPAGVAVAGPLAGLLAGGAAGAATGGILGGLIGLGIPNEHAEVYAESIRRGSVLVAVDSSSDQVERVEQIMEECGVVDLEERHRGMHEAGWFNKETSTPNISDEDWDRIRERETMARERRRVSSYVRQEPPAYEAEAEQFGAEAARDDRYRGLDWSSTDTLLAEAWEVRHPGTWDEHRDAVRRGWDRSHMRMTSGDAEML
jgi:uncharacterized membrane protein